MLTFSILSLMQESTMQFWSVYSHAPVPQAPRPALQLFEVESFLGHLDSTHNKVIAKVSHSKSIILLKPEWSGTLRVVEDHVNGCSIAMTEYMPSIESLDSSISILWDSLRIPCDVQRPTTSNIQHSKPWWAIAVLDSQSFGWEPLFYADGTTDSDLSSFLAVVRQYVPPEQIHSYVSKVVMRVKLSLDLVEEHVGGRNERFSMIVAAARYLDLRVRQFKEALTKLIECIKCVCKKENLLEPSIPTADSVLAEFTIESVAPFVGSVSSEEEAATDGKAPAGEVRQELYTDSSLTNKNLTSDIPSTLVILSWQAYARVSDYSSETLSACVLEWERDLRSAVSDVEKEIGFWAPPLDLILNRVASRVLVCQQDMDTLESYYAKLAWQYQVARTKLVRRHGNDDIDVPELVHDL